MSTMTLTTMAPSMADAIGLRLIPVSEADRGSVFGARLRVDGTTAHVRASASSYASAPRYASVSSYASAPRYASASSYAPAPSAASAPSAAMAARIVPSWRSVDASRLAVPAHVAVAARAMDDAWAAKQGVPAPRGGPA